jgi:hypothetical protein
MSDKKPRKESAEILNNRGKKGGRKNVALPY